MIKTYKLTTTVEVDTECFEFGDDPARIMHNIELRVNQGDGIWLDSGVTLSYETGEFSIKDGILTTT